MASMRHRVNNPVVAIRPEGILDNGSNPALLRHEEGGALRNSDRLK